MCQNCLVKTIHHAQHHFGWDNSLSPVLHVASGSQLEFHCLDAANGWFNAGSTAADIPTLPFDKLNPVSGPVYVEGAQPGDALKVTLESFRPSGFGWTANIPGFGLLADQFSDPALTLWQYDRQGLTPCAFGRYGRVPLKPFAGTLGVAPA
ncbi:acetamidase/formamidase family protein, partial [Klebsiella pneumoniae]